MRCYNCGAELGKGDNCQNCGTNVKVYKKILMHWRKPVSGICQGQLRA